MSIDERLEVTNFPLPAIREVNLSKHPSGMSLGLGELKDFQVDAAIYEALLSGWNKGGTAYTQNAGLPQLRQALARQQSLIDGNEYSADNVVVTIGVQNAVYATLRALNKLGAKRVLIPAIHFGIYKKIPAEFGMEVMCYPLKPDFGIDLDKLEEMLLPDDILIINSPSNPTGRVLSNDELSALGSLLDRKLVNGYALSDEIYGKLVYEGDLPKSFSAFYKRAIVVDGISKSAAAAGLRVGWVISSNAKLAKAITSTNALIISTPPTVNQYAALPVVMGDTQRTINEYKQTLRDNRDVVCDTLDGLNIPYNKPKGSFYIFPDMTPILGDDSKAFCLATAKKENGVVVIPGVAFGAPSCIRISLATNEMAEGMRRFRQAISSI